MKRSYAAFRFSLGSGLGILGLGLMGRGGWPFQATPFLSGVLLLVVGSVMALGVVSPIRKK